MLGFLKVDHRTRYLVFAIFLLLCLTPTIGSSIQRFKFSLPKKNPIKANYIGEIVGFSYAKVSLESSLENNNYNPDILPVKGTYFEAVSGKTYRLIGSYNAGTFQWKLDCFDKNNKFNSVFAGKEDTDGNIEGTWTNKINTYKFYLKKNLR